MPNIDPELKAHARHVLRQSFRRDLQELVNAYTEAGAGLGDLKLEELSALPDASGHGDAAPQVYTDWPAPGLFGPDYRASCGARTLLEALEDDRAECAYVQGYTAFKRVNGVWTKADPELTS